MPPNLTPTLTLTFSIDNETLSEVHARCFPRPWAAPDFKAMFSIPGTFAILAWINERPVGLLLIRVVAAEAEILTVCVIRSCRRIGVAQAMLERGMQEASRLGGRHLFLEVAEGNGAAFGLYEGMGFLEVTRRKGYYADGEDALVMARSI